MKLEFSTALRPLESTACAVTLYFVERSSGSSGFQEEPSADRVPSTVSLDSTEVMVTSVSFPPLTVTLASPLMPALAVPSSGEILILAFEASFAAAASTCLRRSRAGLRRYRVAPAAAAAATRRERDTPPSSAAAGYEALAALAVRHHTHLHCYRFHNSPRVN